MCPPSSLPSTYITTTSPTTLPSLIPPNELSQTAYAHASSTLHPSILAHSLRVYLYAKELAASTHSIYHTSAPKHAHLFLACLYHDIGTAPLYNGPQRFEVEGADAAVAHLARFDVSEEDQKQVWYAIALHTTQGIVQRMGELPALVRKALTIEFSGEGWEETEGVGDVVGFRGEVEERFPRDGIEKVLGDAVVMQAVGTPGKAPRGTWPGELVRAFEENPGWEGVNKAF